MGKKTGPRPQPHATLFRPQDLPTKAELCRLRVRYVKDERLAYLSHLEVIATVERCIRRAHLPFSLGNGFARRMRVQFSSALPVGASSDAEYFDLRLDAELPVGEALARLRAATPPGLAPASAAYVDGRLPALEAWLNRSTWECVLLGSAVPPEELSRAIADLAGQGSLTYQRGEKTKTVDLTACLVAWETRPTPEGTALFLDTRSSNEGSLRPAHLVSAALARTGLAPCDALRTRRTSQFHQGEDGSLAEPL